MQSETRTGEDEAPKNKRQKTAVVSLPPVSLTWKLDQRPLTHTELQAMVLWLTTQNTPSPKWFTLQNRQSVPKVFVLALPGLDLACRHAVKQHLPNLYRMCPNPVLSKVEGNRLQYFQFMAELFNYKPPAKPPSPKHKGNTGVGAVLTAVREAACREKGDHKDKPQHPLTKQHTTVGDHKQHQQKGPTPQVQSNKPPAEGVSTSNPPVTPTTTTTSGVITATAPLGTTTLTTKNSKKRLHSDRTGEVKKPDQSEKPTTTTTTTTTQQKTEHQATIEGAVQLVKKASTISPPTKGLTAGLTTLPPPAFYVHTTAVLLANDYVLPPAAASAFSSDLTAEQRTFITTQPKPATVQVPQKNKILAMDCEMCMAGDTPVLARCTVVNWDEECVYDTYVKPQQTITNYVTKYSGITAGILTNVTTTLDDVHKALSNLIYKDTILVGHSLDNDLKVLKMIHTTIVDTSIIYPHPHPPAKSALRYLAKEHLKKSIQGYATSLPPLLDQDGTQPKTHSSFVDACATLKLFKMKIQKGPEYGTNATQTDNLFGMIGKQSSFKTVFYGNEEEKRYYGKVSSEAIVEDDPRKITAGLCKHASSATKCVCFGTFNMLREQYSKKWEEYLNGTTNTPHNQPFTNSMEAKRLDTTLNNPQLSNEQKCSILKARRQELQQQLDAKLALKTATPSNTTNTQHTATVTKVTTPPTTTTTTTSTTTHVTHAKVTPTSKTGLGTPTTGNTKSPSTASTTTTTPTTATTAKVTTTPTTSPTLRPVTPKYKKVSPTKSSKSNKVEQQQQGSLPATLNSNTHALCKGSTTTISSNSNNGSGAGGTSSSTWWGTSANTQQQPISSSSGSTPMFGHKVGFEKKVVEVISADKFMSWWKEQRSSFGPEEQKLLMEFDQFVTDLYNKAPVNSMFIITGGSSFTPRNVDWSCLAQKDQELHKCSVVWMFIKQNSAKAPAPKESVSTVSNMDVSQ